MFKTFFHYDVIRSFKWSQIYLKKCQVYSKPLSLTRQRQSDQKNQLSDHNDCEASTTRSLQVIKRTGDIEAFDAKKISIAIGRAFLAIEGQNNMDSSRIHDRIAQLTEMVLNTFNRSHNYNLYSYEFNAIKQVEPISSNLVDSLESNIEPSISSLFKKFKKITSTILFITTRNFSIQKNLSISA